MLVQQKVVVHAAAVPEKIITVSVGSWKVAIIGWSRRRPEVWRPKQKKLQVAERLSSSDVDRACVEICHLFYLSYISSDKTIVCQVIILKETNKIIGQIVKQK